MSPTSQTCHQQIGPPAYVINIVVTEKSIKSIAETVEREKLILSWDANTPTKAQLTNLIKSKTSIFEKSRSDKEFNPYFQMAKTQECF